MPDTATATPGYSRLTDYWFCPDCLVWYPGNIRECEYCDPPKPQTTVYPIVYECDRCHCCETPDALAAHDCGMCSL